MRTQIERTSARIVGSTNARIDADWRPEQPSGVRAAVAASGGLEGTFGLPDPDDEHVLAAAVLTRAGVIVTENLKHFPPDRLPADLQVLPAAQFAYNTAAVDPALAARAVQEISNRSGTRGPRRTPPEILAELNARYGMRDATALSDPTCTEHLSPDGSDTRSDPSGRLSSRPGRRQKLGQVRRVVVDLVGPSAGERADSVAPGGRATGSPLSTGFRRSAGRDRRSRSPLHLQLGSVRRSYDSSG